ncbi:MAG: FMN-binding negative transcriptional regulator [Comamonadaceae bacterium]|nr:FMN-binding negative transcriptional regulator [Comamonadaceae bacterium]
MSDAPADYVQQMLRAIVGIEIPRTAGRQVEGQPEPQRGRPARRGR